MAFGNFNLNDLMKDAQNLFGKAQERVTKITAQGEAGAGMVKVEINGKQEITKVSLSDELMQESKEVIEELIAAATNDAIRKIMKATQENMLSFADFMKPQDKNPE